MLSTVRPFDFSMPVHQCAGPLAQSALMILGFCCLSLYVPR